MHPFFSKTRASIILSPVIICRPSSGLRASSSTSFQAMCLSIGGQDTNKKLLATSYWLLAPSASFHHVTFGVLRTQRNLRKVILRCHPEGHLLAEGSLAMPENGFRRKVP